MPQTIRLISLDEIGKIAIQKLNTQQSINLKSQHGYSEENASKNEISVFICGLGNIEILGSLVHARDNRNPLRHIILVKDEKSLCKDDFKRKNTSFYYVETDLKGLSRKITPFLEFVAKNKAFQSIKLTHSPTEIKVGQTEVCPSDDALKKTHNLISELVEDWQSVGSVEKVFLNIKGTGTADLIRMKEIIDAVFWVFSSNGTKIHTSLADEPHLKKKMILEMLIV